MGANGQIRNSKNFVKWFFCFVGKITETGYENSVFTQFAVNLNPESHSSEGPQ